MRLLLFFLVLVAQSALAENTVSVSDKDVVSEILSGYPVGLHNSGDTDFSIAHEAFLAGDSKKLARYAQRLRTHPLEVYVSYYQLSLDLEKAAPQSVDAFLSRKERSPVIDQLRIEWLKFLGKTRQWDLFDKEFPRLIKSDIELTCYELQSRSQKNHLLALRDARILWFDGETLPENCGTLFDAARATGIINLLDIRERLRMALEINNVSLATHLAGLMTENADAMPADIRKASANPARYLGNLSLSKTGEDQRIIALFALHRLAKQNPDLAWSNWERISMLFPNGEQQYFLGWLGYEAARNLDDRAIGWYTAAGNTLLNERQLEWRVRAALRVQDWQAVLDSINSMSTKQQGDIAWRYWKARSLKELGKVVEARTLFAPLSVEYNYYGQLASDELADAQTMSATQSRYQPDEQAIAALWIRPDVQRTVALYRTGLRSEALEEWRWVVSGMNDRELLTAAEIARRNKMFDRAIGAADMTINLHDFSLRYLAPYRDEMKSYILTNGLDEAWVYGLMRQESRFATHAKSGVGAAGLMQIMPSTARWIAQKLGLKNYRNSSLHELDTNLRLGTYYMKAVLSQAENSLVLASAAYNAGPTRALQWRADRPLEGAIYTETIPFDETREYVKKVMSNTTYYADQFGTPTSLRQKMGIIPAKPADKQPGKSNAP